jgi:3-phosphoshikimate 1-carboxyvinyltransferase
VTQTAHFQPAGALRGSVAPPPDKSISHRAALIAAMHDEPVRVRNYLDAADTNSTVQALRSLGALIEQRPDGLLVRGTGLRGLETVEEPIDVGNAGTLMRLLPGWLAAQPAGSWTLDGDESIRRRPVDRIAQPLAMMGARLEAREGRLPPFVVHAGRLHGIEYAQPQASAQVKSCLLLAGLLADGETTVVEPARSRDHTERMLRAAGVRVWRAGQAVTVCNSDELGLDAIDVPGDLSSASFLIAAGIIVPGSRLVLEDVGVNWTRTGFLNIAKRMGGVVVGDLERPPPGDEIPLPEPVSELDVTAGPLVGTTVEPHEVPQTIDELPLVALLGCFADGETVVRGANELRVKESDRIRDLVEGLRGLGAEIEATDDGFAVTGTGGLRGGVLDSRGDHRLAMLGAVAGLASEEGVRVVGIDVAAVSYPQFREHLGTLA